MASLRSRLLVGAGLASAVILLAAGISLYLLIRESLLGQFDRYLRSQAQVMASQVDEEHHRVRLDLGDALPPVFHRGDNVLYLELWDARGRVLQRSPALKPHHLPRPSTSHARARGLLLPGHHPGREVFYHFKVGQGDGHRRHKHRLTLALAARLGPINDTLGDIVELIAAVGVAALVATLGSLLAVMHFGLRPVRGLAGEITAIKETDLARRIDPQPLPEELRPIVDGLNRLLERLRAAFDRERTFTADIAHELRTPLHGLRAKVEVALAHPRQPEAYRATLRECLAILLAAQGMAENLLALARLDAGEAALVVDVIDLRPFLTECWQPFDDRAELAGLETRWHGDNMQVKGDREKLRLLFHNLFDNAVSYGNPDGRISIAMAPLPPGEGVVVTVANSGSTLDEQEARQVFQRFWRGEGWRPTQGGHCGLGLALVQRLAAAMRCAVSVSSTRGGEFIVRVELHAPYSPAAQNPAPAFPGGAETAAAAPAPDAEGCPPRAPEPPGSAFGKPRAGR